MPIDLASIAASFKAPFALQLRSISLAFMEVARRLRARLREASLLESASRDYPTLSFHDDAVTLWIDSLQHGSLAPPPPTRGLGESLGRAGARFGRELRRVPEAVREERLLPELMKRAVRILQVVDASLARFERVSGATFEKTQRTASDLFGEVALLFRAVSTSTGTFRDIAGQMVEARRLFEDYTQRRAQQLGVEAEQTATAAAGAGAALAASQLPGAPPESQAGVFDFGTRLLLGTVLVLPLLPTWLTLLGGPGGDNLRLAILDAFARYGPAKLEQALFALRGQVLDLFYVDLMAAAAQASDFVWGTQRVFLEALRTALDFGFLYGDELVASLVFFVEDLSRYLQYWTVVLEDFRQLFEFLMDYVLWPALAATSPQLALALSLMTSEMGLTGARAATNLFISSGEVVTFLTPEFLLGEDKDKRLREFELLKEVVRAATRPMGPLPAETARFEYPGVPFPHLGWAFFGWGAPDVRPTLHRLRQGIQRNVQENLGAGEDFLEGLADIFDRVQMEAVLLGEPARYRAAAEQAEQLAHTVFHEQAGELRLAMASRRPDLMAEALAGWMATGGFQLIGHTLPLYVEQMDAYWREQQEHPTSPHILSKRARLGCVRMKRLTVDARGRPLDEALAREIAGQFQGAVIDAYATGRERLGRAGHGT